MPSTPRMRLPFPALGAEDWYDTWVSMMESMDGLLFAFADDRNTLVASEAVFTFDPATDLLEWDDDVIVTTPSTGMAQTLAASSLSVADGQMIVADLSRGASTSVTLELSAASVLPPDASAFVLAVRSGSRLYFRNGATLRKSSKVFLGRVDHADTFTATSSQTVFEVASDVGYDCTPMVFVDGLIQTSGYTHVDGVVTFASGLTAGQKVHVRYWS